MGTFVLGDAFGLLPTEGACFPVYGVKDAVYGADVDQVFADYRTIINPLKGNPVFGISVSVSGKGPQGLGSLIAVVRECCDGALLSSHVNGPVQPSGRRPTVAGLAEPAWRATQKKKNGGHQEKGRQR